MYTSFHTSTLTYHTDNTENRNLYPQVREERASVDTQLFQIAFHISIREMHACVA
jgi:hypothetical protein